MYFSNIYSKMMQQTNQSKLENTIIKKRQLIVDLLKGGSSQGRKNDTNMYTGDVC